MSDDLAREAAVRTVVARIAHGIDTRRWADLRGLYADEVTTDYTSLFGGKGTVAGTFIGTLIIGVLANILNLTGVDPYVQQLFKGALIVVAVYVMSRTDRA